MDKTTHTLDTQTKKILSSYASRIRNAGIPIESMIVFGSRVKGLAHAGSDLDTCIISTAFGKDRHAERVFLMNLREGISDLIEPHPLSPEDFANKYDLFAQEIKRTGITFFY